MKNNKGLILAIVLCLGLAIGVYFWQESRISNLQEEPEVTVENPPMEEDITPEEDSPIDTFRYDEGKYTYHGKLIVSGYLTFQERPEAFCEVDCPMYTYASFNVLETENEFLENYIEKQSGNAFVGEMSIGLGCVDDGILWRMNDSDEFGMQEYRNSAETSESILNANAENPITIEAERYLYTSGLGAPECYSHFAQVNVIEYTNL